MKIISIDPADFVILSALRGPDDEDILKKMVGAAVIRYWVDGAEHWGATNKLPFVVRQDSPDHYFYHIESAAYAIGLPIISLSAEEWGKFKSEWDNLGLTKSMGQRELVALCRALRGPTVPPEQS